MPKSWLKEATEEFYNGPEWKRSEELLSLIGDRVDFESVLIISDTSTVRLADQSSEPEDYDVGDLKEITGTMGVPVKHVLEAYASVVHAIIPDNHTVVPWSAIAEGDDQWGLASGWSNC